MNDYKLSPAQARICQMLALVFLAVAVAQIVSIGLALVAPRLLANVVTCHDIRCGMASNPLMLLPEEARRSAEASPVVALSLLDHLDAPATRLKLMGAEALGKLPVVALLLFVAIAILRLGRRGNDDIAAALPWLRRAAVAAMIAVPSIPLGASLRTTVMLGALQTHARFYLQVDVNRFVLNLLLAFVAFAVTWALAAGSRASRDIAEIV